MSDNLKKAPVDKKIPSILVNGPSKNITNLKNNGNTSKKDNISIGQRKSKPMSINTLHKVKTKKKMDDEISFHYSFKKGKFLCEPKILNNFLSFFNIRELFIIMEIDTHIQKAITESDVFKKYLTIRKDFSFKDSSINHNKNKKVNKNNSKNAKNNIVNSIKNKNKSTSRKYYEKYDNSNIVDPVTLGLNDVLVVYPTKAGEKERLEKELQEDKSEIVDYVEESSQKQKLEISLPSLDFSKLNISQLINNNSQIIKKYIKSLSLNIVFL